ncbi:hypothetical protein DFP73DRAFT_558824 [Morchella snyderi]|nr:hypothetical protein DFP73DRAFT_558824 [Morchella snyderi]
MSRGQRERQREIPFAVLLLLLPLPLPLLPLLLNLPFCLGASPKGAAWRIRKVESGARRSNMATLAQPCGLHDTITRALTPECPNLL